jgi:uncharacterized protein YutE (UPF0331/DUF86 family)
VLVEHGVLPPPLADRFLKMAGFRNILVHEYTRVGHRMPLRR